MTFGATVKSVYETVRKDVAMVHEYEKRVENLKKDIADLREVFRQMVDDIRGKDGVGQMGRLRDRVNQGVDWVRDTFGSARDRSAQAKDSVSQWVEQRPLAVMAIALGVGLVAGIVWAGKHVD